MVIKAFIRKTTDALRLLDRAFRQYRKKIAVLAFLGFLSGLFEAVGVNALVPLFSFLTGSNDFGDDLVSKAIKSLFAIVHVTFSIKYLLVFICILFILKALALMWASYVKIQIIGNYSKSARTALFRKTLAASWPYLLKQKLGHLETVILTNVQYGELMLDHLSSIITIMSMLFIYTAVAVDMSPITSILAVALGAVLFFIFKPLITRTRLASNDIEAINRQTSHHVNENVMGMKTVKAMGVYQAVVARGESFFESLRRLKVRITVLKMVPENLMPSIGIVFVMIVLAISYKLPHFNLAVLAAVVYLIQQIFLYIQQLQRHVQMVYECAPYVRAITEFDDGAERELERDRGTADFSLRSEFKFSDVSFAYENRKSVLEHVDFRIRQGEVVGLIGPSGAGKTTIVDILLRLFDPSKGTISVDGVDIASIKLSAWREHVGYVSQDVFLMNDTVENNIRFYNQSLSKQDLVKAAKMANIYDVIENLPQGFDTVIGERGVLLSAGQRQRIIIARVLARKPELLILDEATSALDNQSEMEIQKVIDGLKGKLTVFVIAHRLSTVVNADQLLVLEKGRIVERGKPQDLLADKSSYFHRLYNLKQ
ncbi:MAG: ABC transporter ATP-binding protein [Minisyncoccia bacterium]|jgi:ABC-type multidrug transport system fused ATPase/permease subunit